MEKIHMEEKMVLPRHVRILFRDFGFDAKKVLDIGFLHGMTLRCWKNGSEGADINDEAIKKLSAEGFIVHQFNVEDSFPLPDESFDAVYCNNVFEHLVAPHMFLVRVHKILKPGGLMALGVPVVAPVPFRWIYHLLGYKGHLAQAHINFFTKRTLLHTVERGGFKTRKIYFPFVSRLPFASIGMTCLIVAERVTGFKYPHKQEQCFDPSWAKDRLHFR